MPGGTLRGFAERVALIVGASGGLSGVGRAAALQLALEGAYVIVAHPSHDEESGKVAGSLRELGTLAHAVEADMRREEDIAHVFGAVNDLYQRLDLLVFVAAHETPRHVRQPFDEISAAFLDDVLSLNLRAAALCAQAAVKLMRGRPAAGIVNIVGASGMTCGARRRENITPIGVAAGAGIIGLTEALAADLAPRVRVNCVAVGADARSVTTETSAVAPDEAARACLYLLSPEAKHITGQTLLVGSG